MERKYGAQCDARIGKIHAPVHPVKGMKEPWHYRNKAQIPFSENEAGQAIAGFYKTKTHSIVDMDRCLIQTGEADAILAGLKKELATLGVRSTMSIHMKACCVMSLSVKHEQQEKSWLSL